MPPETRMPALVADDERITATVLAASLRGWDFDVTVVNDGAAAWEVMSGDAPPALAILDWMMPQVDGIALCARVRAQPALASMYIVLLTSRDSIEDMVAGLEAGADEYLVKPFNANELRARVRTARRVISLQRDVLARHLPDVPEPGAEGLRRVRGWGPCLSSVGDAEMVDSSNTNVLFSACHF